MHTFILELRQDHGDIIRLLRVLWFKLRALHDDRDADYETMLRVLDFLIELADQFHHPREDILFDLLRQRFDNLRDVLDELQKQHAIIPRQGQELRELLKAAADGQPVELERLSRLGHDYLLAQRWHIHEEEFAVFALADRTLDEADWATIEQRAAPLLAGQRDRRRKSEAFWVELPEIGVLAGGGDRQGECG
ncbi:MAG: hemerythrin domain-containing protein [Xanthomonadales bacterium]|nr:hemerythrin domain-containing protein [Xanthomonadales bacterium]